IFSLVLSVSPIVFLQSSIGTIFAEEEKIINFYSSASAGDWQNSENVQSLPEVGSLGTIDSFSESNSAVYENGPLSLVIENFQSGFDADQLNEKQIESAKIKFSFAIGEKETNIFIEQENISGEGEVGEMEDQIGFGGRIRNFVNTLATKTVNIVKSSLVKIVSIAKAEEEIDEQATIIEIQDTSGEETEETEEVVEQNIEIETENTNEENIEEELKTEEEFLGEEETEEIREERTEENIEEDKKEEKIEKQEQKEQGQEAKGDDEEVSITEEESTTTEEAIITQVEIIEATSTEATTTEATTTQATSTNEGIQLMDPNEDIIGVSLEDTFSNIDTKIIIWYSLNNQGWQKLDTVSDYPLSNALNNGYFEYNTPFLKNWEDIKNLKIKFEGVIGGETNIIFYLDSVWIETIYQEQEAEEQEAVNNIQDTNGQGENTTTEETATDEETNDQQQEIIEEESTTTDEEIIEEETGEENTEEEGEEENLEEEPEEEVEEINEIEEEELEEEKEKKEEDNEEEKQEEKIKILSEKKGFKADEDPIFKFRYKKVYDKFLSVNNLDVINLPIDDFSSSPNDLNISDENNINVVSSSSDIADSTSTEEADSSSENFSEENNSKKTNIENSTSSDILEATSSEVEIATSSPDIDFQNSSTSITSSNLVLGTFISEPSIIEQPFSTSTTSSIATSSDFVNPEENIESPNNSTTSLDDINGSDFNTTTDTTLFSTTSTFTNKSIQNLWEGVGIGLEVIGPDGNIKNIGYDISYQDKGEFSIEFKKPSQFQPGLYKFKLKLEDGSGGILDVEEFYQEFRWGVLAINVNKSIYLPSEQAYIQMAVLTDSGSTICDANLELRIKNQELGIETVLSTQDGTIQYSNKCGPDNVTDVPDYFAYYQIGETSTYQMKLINLDNDYEIEDSFEVRNYVPFDIERIGPTRIYPPADYEMKIKIRVNEDFNGQVIESVPGSFEVKSQFPISNFQFINTKQLIWDVNWGAGEKHELSYQFDAPDISPYLYLLGPLEIENFQEIRQWQIAADAVTLTQRAYIFENDDGADVNSNSNSSDINTALTSVKKGERIIARIQIDNTGTTAISYGDFRLQFDKNDSNWQEFTSSSELLVSHSIPGTNATSLTSVKAGTCSGGTSWQNGTFHENINKTAAYTLGASKCTEFAFTI
ncbi:MAG: hypothetical protein ACTSQA_04480, partial [Candidatus Heimdallarchaeaceae archaeon]